MLILLLVFGYLFTKVLIKSVGSFEALTLGLLLSIGMFTFLIYIYSWIGIKITTLSVLVTLFLLIVTCYLMCKKFKIDVLQLSSFKFNKINEFTLIEKVIAISILGVLGLSFFLSLYFPITVWDALALYDFRAKIITETGFFVQVARNYEYFAHYPLFTSLSHTVFYLVGTNNPQFIYSILFICFGSVFYLNLKNIANRKVALVATLLLITIPEIFQHSTIAYTNLPYTIFYVSGLIYLYNAYIYERLDLLFVSSLLIGLSTWVRSDLPFWLTGILFVILLSIIKKSIKPILIYLVPFLIIQQPWSRFNSSMFGKSYSTVGQVTNASSSLMQGIDINRLIDIFMYIYNNVFIAWGTLSVLFISFVIISIVNKSIKKTLFFLGFIIVDLFLLFAGTYLFSMHVNEWKEIADSAVRMSMFFPPLMLYYISIVIGKTDIKLLK